MQFITDAPLHPAIPRVLCPRCALRMRLSQVAPDTDGMDIMKFDCDCGFEYQMSAPAKDELEAGRL